jgi:hypothetical protein
MKLRSLNWPLWTGFLLSLFVLISYPFIFAQWPVTRDVPWASLLLLVIAVVLLFVGIRGAFRAGRGRLAKISASVLSVISVAALGLFVFTTFIMPRWLPPSKGAPQVGQKAPEFTLIDTAGKQVALSELLSTPINGKAPKGVLLIFYRGSW